MEYYVTHPNMETSALVHAPATEKARTTFLDYLERTGRISRADRQHWRKNMVAEKMEDPYDVTADVELHYGYEEAGGYLPEPGLPYQAEGPGSMRQGSYDRSEIPPSGGQTIEAPYREVLPGEVSSVPEGDFREVEEPQRPTHKTIDEVAKESPRSLSPIARKALEGYVE